ncbi:hypothetical protein AAGF08_07055 [Algoriphagus sp. SE2]|uniref:hypothetical protein n=1 Tax=Algoriphagus sp. SE2 TaxID=3141536 RepID=UPI0031CD482C
MNKTAFLSSCLLVMLTTSCWWLNPKYRKGYFPRKVTNFEALNTSYNDYNMDIRVLFHEMDVIFSSDRPGGKGGFDLYLVGIPKY